VTDSRRARSRETQTALMHAAEKLIAAHGIENVTIRDIIAAAGQKNESALQYHFGSLAGLVEAIHQHRSLETQTRRAELLSALLTRTNRPTLRELCELMVRPAFELARESAGFRRFVQAFGHELALTDASALARVSSYGGGGDSGQRLGDLLRSALPHLDDEGYQLRMEGAVRLCAASIYHQARQRQAFRGRRAELFLNHLIDALVGLLSAPVSTETRASALLPEKAHDPR